ncbi:MAG: hypothetical protein NWE75_07365 [Candidatus Bathyarchaeota archaeon]|nr:hypothetical protein [Candidatus Bathyarchaeota archaeon]
MRCRPTSTKPALLLSYFYRLMSISTASVLEAVLTARVVVLDVG